MTGGAYHIISSSLNSKASAATSTISSGLLIRKDYGSTDLNINVEDGAAATDLLVSGNISEVLSSGIGKSGAGQLTLSGTNNYTGSTNINAGTLSILGTGKIYAGSNWAPRIVNVASSAVLEIDRWNGDGSLGQSDFRASDLVLNGGTLRYAGSEITTPSPIDGNTGRAFSLGVNGGTLESAAPAGYVFAITQYNGDPGTYSLPAFNSTLNLTGSGNGYIAKSLSGSGGVTKSGSGTWSLVRPNSYSGATVINAGTLSLGNGFSNSNLADSSSVIVASGATLHLNYSGTDTVNALSFAGIARPPGIYSSSNSPFITGPGTLTVSTGPATDYAGWAAFHTISGVQSGDDDSDGMSNFAEYAFGQNPTVPSGNPVSFFSTATGPHLTYTRRMPSLTGHTHRVMTSTHLTGWTEDSTATQTVIATSGDVETVQVTLSSSLLSETRLFIRIQAQ